MPERLPLDVQTLYAELVEHLTALEAHRSLGSLTGTFVTKVVKGRTYAYLQQSVAGVRRQVYLGPYDETVRRLAERYQAEHGDFRADRAHAERLCAMLRRGGAIATDAAPARVLRALADSGVFRSGGVLVGTHAFSVLGNVLGIRWRHGTLRTQDIDLAADVEALRIAVPSDSGGDVPGALERLEMGFFPVPPFHARDPSTSFRVRGGLLRVDLLTPARRAGVGAPVYLPAWKAAAHPLRFLDYLLEEPARAATVDAAGVLVHVPSPPRFALHKLVVSQERGAHALAKVEKDLDQAEQVLSVLAEDRPGDLRLAWDDLKARPGMRRRAMQGAQALRRRSSAAGAALAAAIPELLPAP